MHAYSTTVSRRAVPIGTRRHPAVIERVRASRKRKVVGPNPTSGSRNSGTSTINDWVPSRSRYVVSTERKTTAKQRGLRGSRLSRSPGYAWCVSPIRRLAGLACHRMAVSRSHAGECLLDGADVAHRSRSTAPHFGADALNERPIGRRWHRATFGARRLYPIPQVPA